MAIHLKRYKHNRHEPKYWKSIWIMLFIITIIVVFCRVVKVRAEETANIKVAAIKTTQNTILSKNEQLVRDNAELKEQTIELTKLASLPIVEKSARMIKFYFPEETIIALAVFKNESGLDPSKMNWNCYYNGKSTACKPQDRALAWSVDCGLTMINVAGKTCPQELFDTETNLKAARAKYDRRSWSPWVAHWNGAYKQSLDWAENLLAKI